MDPVFRGNSVTTYLTLKELPCKDVMKWFETNKYNKDMIKELTVQQWTELKDNIHCPTYDARTEVEQITQDNGQVQLTNPPIFDNLQGNERLAARRFHTKCLCAHLQQKYNGDTMKKKWYDMIKQNNDDNSKFAHFTDVKEIEDNAFRQSDLTIVDIPSTVTKIGNSAFEKNRLTTVNIPNVTEIGYRAFRDNKLTEVNMPNVTEIGAWAFYEN